MTLSTFTPEQMIEFCFMSSTELDNKIAKLQKDFFEYSLRIKDEQEPFSHNKHNEFLSSIMILSKCKDAQFKFLDSFLNKG